MSGPWRVLVVDDSALSREALRHALELDPGLKVVGEAKTGEEAIALVRTLSPHLVTMDLQMPGMGGLKAIEAIMAERPTPVVVISERSSSPQVDLNYEAISRGALELLPKSAVFGVGPDDVKHFAAHLRQLVADSLMGEVVAAAPAPTIPVSAEPPLLVGIGASTGGPKALARLLADLPRDFPLPVAVVQHMAEDFFDSFVRFLADASGRPVEQAANGTVMTGGKVYVAPPRQELFVKENLSVKLLPPPPATLISPSVDSLFFSMANALKGRGVGVLLTGMGDDGAQGLLRMRRMGARTIVQERESCAVFGMPKAAIELGAAERIVPLSKVAAAVLECLGPPSTGPVAAGAPATAGHAPAQVQKRRVLVVDDDVKALAAAKKTLEAGGYEVQLIDNPLMVAGVLRRTVVDLVLLESELVTMKGAVVVQSLRNHGLARVPVFLYSSLGEVALQARASECGAVGFITKSGGALLREVNAFLGGPERRQG